MLLVLGDATDLRTQTRVLYAQMSPDEYLRIVGEDFKNFTIQRRRESHRAYKRMKDDIREGALLPSITLAVKPESVPTVLRALEQQNDNEVKRLISDPGSVDILDGLQRTFILSDLKAEGIEFKDGQTVLVEFWLEDRLERLIYRIIVLNAGQKAMSVRHQIELLFMSLREVIQERIPNLEIYMERDETRRRKPRKFQLDIIASAYQAFISESTEVKRDNLIASRLGETADLDLSEAEISKQFEDFVKYLGFYADLDAETHRVYAAPLGEDDSDVSEFDMDELTKKPVSFVNWFASINVALGFFSAVAQFTKSDVKLRRMEKALLQLNGDMRSAPIGDDPLGTVDFVRVRSAINPRKINIGLATRRLLTNGFKEYFRESGETNLSDCWKLAVE